MGGIAIGGAEGAEVHHRERNGVGLVSNGDQMEVIRHEDLGVDARAALLGAGGEEVEELLAIGVAEEDSLTVVAALGDMQPVAQGSETVLAWREGRQESWVLEARNLIYILKE